MCDAIVELVDDWHDRDIVVTRCDTHQHDRGSGSFSPAEVKDRFNAARDIANSCVVHTFGRFFPNIVRAAHQHDNSWIDVIQFTVFQSPENVLCRVAAPREVGSIPTKKVLPPVGQEMPVLLVACTPAPGY